MLVTDLSNKEDDDNEQETSEMQFEEFASKTDVLVFAIRSKAKAKPRRRTSTCSSAGTILSVKDLGLILSQKLIRLSLTQCHNNWVLFFVMVIHLEKKMGRLNSGDWKIIFGTNLSSLNKGLMKCGKVKWQEAEVTREDFNSVLIHQDKKYFISELFNNVVIPDGFFKYIFSSDVRPIYIPSQIQGWHLEDKFWAKDRRYFLRLWILWIKNT